MEFTFDEELLALQAEAEAVAADAVERYGRRNDSWLCGFSREFSLELGERGWVGVDHSVAKLGACGSAPTQPQPVRQPAMKQVRPSTMLRPTRMKRSQVLPPDVRPGSPVEAPVTIPGRRA